ncbi:Lrp/AsnC family transcriptional regulator [Candidatus Woesearchaeota archaeon]|nr:Lrp/AsnC family transcriptional regulator [Candidatus Woesearchaeota archaeon]
MVITSTEKKFLYLYSDNCRMTYSQLGKKIKKSPQNTRYYISTMEKDRILNYNTLVDYSYLGLLMFRVYFKGGFAQGIGPLKEYISKSGYLSSISTISGQYDLSMEFLAKNPSRFNKELKQLVQDYKELSNYDLIINVVTHIFPKSYLLNKTDDIIIGGDRNPLKLSGAEMELLKLLVNEPRIRLTEMARRSQMNIKTVISRLRILQEELILGYKTEFDMNRFGIYKNRITLKLHNINVLTEQNLLKFCVQNPHIITLNKTMGLWDIEIDIETPDMVKFREIFFMIREQFKDIIQSFNYFRIFNTPFRKYVPSSYWSEKEVKL